MMFRGPHLTATGLPACEYYSYTSGRRSRTIHAATQVVVIIDNRTSGTVGTTRFVCNRHAGTIRQHRPFSLTTIRFIAGLAPADCHRENIATAAIAAYTRERAAALSARRAQIIEDSPRMVEQHLANDTIVTTYGMPAVTLRDEYGRSFVTVHGQRYEPGVALALAERLVAAAAEAVTRSSPVTE